MHTRDANSKMAACHAWILAAAVVGGMGHADAAEYYINNGSTNGDVYCQAAGNDTSGDGSALAPYATLAELITQCDLEGDDVVFLDTGTYTWGSQITIGSADEGSDGHPVTFQGSTNAREGGTVILTSPAINQFIKLDQSDYLTFRDIYIRNNNFYTIYVNNAAHCRFEGLTIKSTHGHHVSNASGGTEAAVFERCLFINGNDAIYTRSGNWVFDRCVFWNQTDYALNLINSPSRYVSNCVFAGATSCRAFRRVPNAGDYNVFWNQGRVSSDYTSLGQLQLASGGWRHCTTADPLFANASQGDFHVRSVEGTWSNGTWVTHGEHSPCIDLGDADQGSGDETAPHGGRMNAGVYGSTDQASRSRTNRWLTALSFRGGGTVTGAAVRLYWNHGNFDPEDVVDVELSTNGGLSWASVEEDVPVTNEYVVWNSGSVPQSPICLWRVTNAVYGVGDATENPMTLRNGAMTYLFYVNDASTAGDVYTSAIGTNANHGASPDAPKDSVQDILDDYVLGPGDTIYVDTGTYRLESRLTFDVRDRGDASGYLTVQGSTNFAAGGTLLRLRTANPANVYGVLYCNGASYVRVRDVRCYGVYGYYGVLVENNSDHCVFENVTAYSFQNISFYMYSGTDIEFRRCLAWKSITGFRRYSGSMHLDRCVAWKNTGSQVYSTTGTTVSNSIFVGVYAYGGGTPAANQLDYNLYNVDFIKDGVTWTAWTNTLSDVHSIQSDPLFADGDGFDFHLLSEEGRYSNGVWVVDDASSPAIDAGHPAADFSHEPGPNGERMNCGLWGNTDQASKSRTDPWLTASSYADGGKATGALIRLEWDSGNFDPGDTVDVEVSTNEGVLWVTVTNDAPVADGYALWSNPAGEDETLLCLWRVTNTAYAVGDQTASLMLVRQDGGFSFYVNDGSTAGDVYTSAVGTNSNHGASADAPKDDVQDIVDDYVLGSGDTIYVDTGTYRLESRLTFDVRDSGDAGGYMTLQGSTNFAAGGTLMRLRTANPPNVYGVLYCNGARYVRVRDVRCYGIYGLYAVLVENNSDHCVFEHVTGYSFQNLGFFVGSGTATEFQRCVAWKNVGGFRRFSGSMLLDGCVAWSNAGSQVVRSPDVAVSNSIFVGTHAYSSIGLAANAADYNVYHVGAMADGVTWSDWTNTANDVHSVQADPLFANGNGFDFHLLSKRGRYSNGVWVVDGVMSPAIDAGHPDAGFQREPAPNGGRLNCGIWGNTSQASRSKVAGTLFLMH